VQEIYIYILTLLITVFFLNTGFAYGNSGNIAQQNEQNLLLIEYLAQHSDKPKNYRREPKEPVFNGYLLKGTKNHEVVTYEYAFPLLGKKESTLKLTFYPVNFSSTISKFGVHNSCFARADSNTYSIKSTDENYLLENMNRDGFYFQKQSDSYAFGVDYNYLVNLSSEIGTKIAMFIVRELQNQNCDGYVNRVRATLNFVQYIPYGQPDFDAGEYSYFEISLPHETLAISYADCDSKSVLFASILKSLIKLENIILVDCTSDGVAHMIVGVSNLPFPGQRVDYNGKDYLLLETTTPVSLESHSQLTNYSDIRVRELT
jgi:hypothetical protein